MKGIDQDLQRLAGINRVHADPVGNSRTAALIKVAN
jgi:hypothetical protein